MTQPPPAGPHAGPRPGGVVVVTGVSRVLGAAFANALAQSDIEVVGVDLTPPHHDLGRARYVRADITSPMIGRVLAEHAAEAVVHLALVSASGSGHSRSAAKEINVLGGMQLFAACQQVSSVRKLVLQSSISVYGASPRMPARFTESDSESHEPQSGLGKDAVEVETYARGLARRRPDCVVTTLRLANLMGAGHSSQIARYLTLPVVPRVMGFDARLQFLHPDDAVAALRLVCLDDVPGTFNVAADDVLTLSQALGLLGRPSIPVIRQAANALGPGMRRLGPVSFSADEIDALTFGRVMDVSRFAAASGFAPSYSSRAALQEFAGGVDPGALSRQRVDAGLDAVGGVVQRVGRFLDGVRR